MLTEASASFDLIVKGLGHQGHLLSYVPPAQQPDCVMRVLSFFKRSENAGWADPLPQADLTGGMGVPATDLNTSVVGFKAERSGALRVQQIDTRVCSPV